MLKIVFLFLKSHGYHIIWLSHDLHSIALLADYVYICYVSWSSFFALLADNVYICNVGWSAFHCTTGSSFTHMFVCLVDCLINMTVEATNSSNLNAVLNQFCWLLFKEILYREKGSAWNIYYNYLEGYCCWI